MLPLKKWNGADKILCLVICDDTDYLRLRCQPVRVEVSCRPGKVVVHAVEAEPKEVLGLFCRAPPVPSARLVGARDRRQPWDGYDFTVLINGSGLSQLAHRRTWHRPTMWRATVAKGKRGARAPVSRRGFPLGGEGPEFSHPLRPFLPRTGPIRCCARRLLQSVWPSVSRACERRVRGPRTG
jgi:hypothetical protein